VSDRLRWPSVILAILIFSLACGGSQAGNGATTQTIHTLRISWPFPSGHTADLGIRYFITQIQDNKAANLTITSYPAAQLYDDTTTVPAVVNGTVDVGLNSAGRLTQFAGAADVFDIPFEFKDTPSVDKALRSGVTDELNSVLDKHGIHIIGWLFAGPIDTIGTRGKQVKVIGDLKGQKFRTYSTISTDWIQSLGASSQVVASTEVYLDLQTGTLDGVFSNVPNGVLAYKWYEVLKYLTIVPGAATTVFPIEINMKTWTALTVAQRAALEQAAIAAENYDLGVVQQVVAAWPATLKRLAPSVQVYTIPDSELPNWKSTSQNVMTAYLNESGDLGKKVLATIQASQ
jgi:TRAP-type C4-dicarboxylate transport system substrate-binding protein